MGFVLTYSLGRDAILWAFGASPHSCPSHQHSKKTLTFGISLFSVAQIPMRQSDLCIPPLSSSVIMDHQLCPCTHLHLYIQELCA